MIENELNDLLGARITLPTTGLLQPGDKGSCASQGESEVTIAGKRMLFVFEATVKCELREA